LDQKFGSGGIAAIPVGDAAFANAVVVDPYGNIDVSGTATTGGSNHFFAARLDPAGAPDPSFGNGGVTVLNPTAAAWGMVLQPDGSLVLAGQESHNSTQAFMAARVEADGSLDPTFGDGGFATIPIGSWAAGYAIALQSDGKLVIGGNAKSSSGSNMAAIARLDPDGSLDSSFVSGGILQFAGGGLNAVTIDSSGRIYLAGVGVTAMRLMPSGSVDTSFAHGGFGGYCNGTNCAANGVSIDPTSGNVVLAGITHILGVPEILVLRIFP
jgi:uncharacterized delta-60 repeat protein